MRVRFSVPLQMRFVNIIVVIVEKKVLKIVVVKIRIPVFLDKIVGNANSSKYGKNFIVEKKYTMTSSAFFASKFESEKSSSSIELISIDVLFKGFFLLIGLLKITNKNNLV